MSRYLEELKKTGMSLLIYRDGELIFSSAEGGVYPLIEAIDVIGRKGLHGSIVADRIVGRAAALLVAYTGAAEVHAALISAGAKEALRSRNIRFHFAEETPAIRSRDGEDLCPFERLILGICDPDEAYRRIKAELSRS